MARRGATTPKVISGASATANSSQESNGLGQRHGGQERLGGAVGVVLGGFEDGPMGTGATRNRMILRLNECGRGDSNPHVVGHWNLNPARLPVPPRPRRRAALDGPVRVPSVSARTGADQSTPRALRRRSTWPVAFTLYCARLTLPAGSTTIVERIRPS